jgi:hypothetical protein
MPKVYKYTSHKAVELGKVSRPSVGQKKKSDGFSVRGVQSILGHEGA